MLLGPLPCFKSNGSPSSSWMCMYTHSTLTSFEGVCCHSGIQEWTFCSERQELFINSAFQNKWSALTCCAYLNNCSSFAVAALLTVGLCLRATLNGFYSTLISLASPKCRAWSWFACVAFERADSQLLGTAYVWQQGPNCFEEDLTDPRGVALNVEVRGKRRELTWEILNVVPLYRR